MKKSLRIITVGCAFAAMFGAAALTGCGSAVLTIDDIEKDGYTCVVTFDCAEGEWDPKVDEIRQFYVKSGSLIPEVKTLDFAKARREGYLFLGYYKGTKSGDTITYGAAWDYKTDRVTENVTLYAKWAEKQDYSLIVHYGENLSRTVALKQDSEGKVSPVTAATAAVPGYTVLAYYSDEAKTQEVSFPYDPGLNEENTTAQLWADAVEGSYQVIRSADDFRKLNFQPGTGVYLMTDIDMREIYDKGYGVDFPSFYSGSFLGNGHTISNLKIEQAPASRTDAYYGIFRRLTGKAVIKDVTFANVTLDVKLNNPLVSDYFVGLLAGSSVETVCIENVTVSGTFTCKVMEDRFDDVAVAEFVGGNAKVTGCDYSGVTMNKEKI